MTINLGANHRLFCIVRCEDPVVPSDFRSRRLVLREAMRMHGRVTHIDKCCRLNASYSYTVTEYPPTPTHTHTLPPFFHRRQRIIAIFVRTAYIYLNHVVSVSDYQCPVFQCRTASRP
jgi:hypothetical protein